MSRPPSPRRQTTPPAAWIGRCSWPSLMPLWTPAFQPALRGRDIRLDSPVLPVLDQVLLQINQRLARPIEMVPGPGAVGTQPPGRDAGVHREVDQIPQLGLVAGIGDPDHPPHPAIHIPFHQAPAAPPHPPPSPSPPSPEPTHPS